MHSTFDGEEGVLCLSERDFRQYSKLREGLGPASVKTVNTWTYRDEEDDVIVLDAEKSLELFS